MGGGKHRRHRAPRGGAAFPRAAASLSLAQLSFIVGVARRPPPCYFLPPTSISRRAGAGGGAASERGAGRCGRGRGGAAPQPLYRAARGAIPAPWERGEAEEEEEAAGGGSSRRGAAAPEHFRRAPCGEEESRPAGGGAILLFQRRGSGCEGRSRRAASLLRLLRRFPRCQRAEGPGCSVPAPPQLRCGGGRKGSESCLRRSGRGGKLLLSLRPARELLKRPHLEGPSGSHLSHQVPLPQPSRGIRETAGSGVPRRRAVCRAPGITGGSTAVICHRGEGGRG